MGNLQSCAEQAHIMFERLKNCGFTMSEIQEGAHCFSVCLTDNMNELALVPEGKPAFVSISYPPDAMGNRVEDLNDNERPCTIETALKDRNGDLLHEFQDEEWDYEYTIQRFSEYDELINEINRLKNLFTNMMNSE